MSEAPPPCASAVLSQCLVLRSVRCYVIRASPCERLCSAEATLHRGCCSTGRHLSAGLRAFCVPAQDAKSDLVNVLSSLEAHWHVLEAEVVEINRDIDYCEQCLRKYGEWFNSPLQYLRELKRTKKNKMKEIIRTMESFNNNLQGGKKLVKSLEKQAVRLRAMRRGLPTACPGAAARVRRVLRPLCFAFACSR